MKVNALQSATDEQRAAQRAALAAGAPAKSFPAHWREPHDHAGGVAAAGLLEKKPEGQAAHASAPTAPGAGLYVPAAQATGEAAPSGQNAPAGQGLSETVKAAPTSVPEESLANDTWSTPP